MPIPGKQFSNVEASAHFTIEYEDSEPRVSKALDEGMLLGAKQQLAKCLQASMEVANETEAKKEYKEDKLEF